MRLVKPGVDQRSRLVSCDDVRGSVGVATDGLTVRSPSPLTNSHSTELGGAEISRAKKAMSGEDVKEEACDDAVDPESSDTPTASSSQRRRSSRSHRLSTLSLNRRPINNREGNGGGESDRQLRRSVRSKEKQTVTSAPPIVQIVRKISRHAIQFAVEPANVYGAEHLLRLFGESWCLDNFIVILVVW